MSPFLLRRFAVWWVPLSLVVFTAPIVWDVIGQLLALGFMIVWTVGLVQLEKRIPGFGRWMNSRWKN